MTVAEKILELSGPISPAQWAFVKTLRETPYLRLMSVDFRPHRFGRIILFETVQKSWDKRPTPKQQQEHLLLRCSIALKDGKIDYAKSTYSYYGGSMNQVDKMHMIQTILDSEWSP